MQHTPVLIIGGGLAGLTAAIHLSRQQIPVVLVEKEAYPHHKVCGEYISNEVLPYLRWLDADPEPLGPAAITQLEFSVVSGKILSAALPLGGFGLSRYTFDQFLYHKALQNGASVIRDQITDLSFDGEQFSVACASGEQITADVVIGAFGKRSGLDMKLGRSFVQQKSPWLAVKGHYKGVHPDHVVGLHHFDGGYCGVSKVEEDTLNICYLVQYDSFKRYRNIEEHQEQVLYRNPVLKAVMQPATPLFSRPLTISQISFDPKPAVEQGILMAGDSAGLIHPLCGNGMAMAIHAGKIAAEAVMPFLRRIVAREAMEQAYNLQWQHLFRQRLATGRRIAALLQRRHLSAVLVQTFGLFPAMLPVLIRKTHGAPITIPEYAGGYEI
ncbi:NAD(P)/FAD-dependent oxidoreductase [Taibaiella koreensis]|uniref:NAD(P)/FAD-dependent oxidoreductase n=1 Tax=Taibaiella koreensis TaxID=1268548 RepID=UPI000E5998EC|nr:NAD(P)/FAD-dependent oxidoreductase [Taibaiella koreensis]